MDTQMTYYWFKWSELYLLTREHHKLFIARSQHRFFFFSLNALNLCFSNRTVQILSPFNHKAPSACKRQEWHLYGFRATDWFHIPITTSHYNEEKALLFLSHRCEQKILRLKDSHNPEAWIFFLLTTTLQTSRAITLTLFHWVLEDLFRKHFEAPI